MENDLTINPRFQYLLASLTDEEFTQLETSIRSNGCETPIAVWNEQIIDGHNRYAICMKHGVAFDVIDRTRDFADEEAVIEWMYTNQLGRRNLNPNQKLLYIGELYELRKKRHGGDRRSEEADISSRQSDDLKIDLAIPQIKSESETSSSVEDIREPQIVIDEYSQEMPDDFQPAPETNGHTAEGMDYEIDPEFQRRPSKTKKAPTRTGVQIAKEFGVSPRTVERAATVAKAIETLPQETRESFIQGKITQKAVLAQANGSAEPETPIDDPTRDKFTEMAVALSKVLHGHLHAIQDTIGAARLDFYNAGQDFDQWCEHLPSFPLKIELPLLDVKMLKSIRVCKKCHGAKCPICHETGYMKGDIFLMY